MDNVLEVFCVYDTVTERYANPMFLVNAGHAVRALSDEVNRPAADNQLYQHPGDYKLYHLGAFHPETAAFDLHKDPKLVVRCLDLVAQKQ